MEELICTLLRLNPIPNTGGDVCFDGESNGVFFEIKSFNSSSPIYEWRRAKETNSGKPVVYAFCKHSLKKPENLTEVYEKLPSLLKSVYLISLGELNTIIKKCPLRKITSENQNGYNRVGYCDGYRNLKLRQIETLPLSLLSRATCVFYDTPCESPLYASAEASAILFPFPHVHL